MMVVVLTFILVDSGVGLVYLSVSVKFTFQRIG